MSSRRQRSIPLGGRYRQVSLYILRPKQNERHFPMEFGDARMKIVAFWFKCPWTLFLRVQLEKCQHWPGAKYGNYPWARPMSPYGVPRPRWVKWPDGERKIVMPAGAWPRGNIPQVAVLTIIINLCPGSVCDIMRYQSGIYSRFSKYLEISAIQIDTTLIVLLYNCIRDMFNWITGIRIT